MTTCIDALRRIVALAALAGALVSSTHAAAQSSANYALGPGDVLSIQVYEEPDLSFPEMRIGDTG
ncbi:MAG: polysaccharide biosynthesis/export family protein, partial [Pseudomonadota bacterium]|nr:polysaccharide biosynthesis/export family protein [Pseudomonadota bacterium]